MYPDAYPDSYQIGNTKSGREKRSMKNNDSRCFPFSLLA